MKDQDVLTKLPKNLYETNYYFFTVLTAIVFILYVISAIGLSRSAPEYLSPLQSIVQLYIGIFLIWRFNPFVKKAKFSDLDRKVAYSAGLFIISTTIVKSIVDSITPYFRKQFEDKLPSILQPNK